MLKGMFHIREPVNALTHLSMLVLGIVGLILLIVRTYPDPSRLVSAVIFGTSIIVLYGASTVYHWARTSPRGELILRRIDHMAIFVLIAGTYTPVLAISLDGAWKWGMLLTVWLLAAIGVGIKASPIRLARWLSTSFYVLLGWFAVIPLRQLLLVVPVQGLVLLIAGGAAYTMGGVVYARRWFDSPRSLLGFHGIFHIFVMVGTLLHFLMIYMYVIPS